MDKSIDQMRMEYSGKQLSEQDLAANPLIQFSQWFEEAVAAQLFEPNAMTLATADGENKPSARTLLLKHFDEKGFVFCTNYESRKAKELEQNPWGCILFWWRELYRQVRIDGKIVKIEATESDKYFANRPRGSQLGACSSQQSAVISSRDVLEQQFAEYEEKYKDQQIPRPDFWGGYRLIPELIEFWQGRINRMHDRLCFYGQQDGQWQVKRLSP